MTTIKKRLVRWLIDHGRCAAANAISPSLTWYFIAEDMRKEWEKRNEAETIYKADDGHRF